MDKYYRLIVVGFYQKNSKNQLIFGINLLSLKMMNSLHHFYTRNSDNHGFE